jgi:cbb3-type cytochrome oxidase subunit 1
MKNIGRWFILMGISYAILGMGLGIWMGINQDFGYAHLHAHINLIGWASMALFGLIYRAFPKLVESRVAMPQFLLSAVGTPIFMVGIPLAQSETTILLAVVGSFMVLTSMVLFLVIFATRGKA